MTLDTFTQDDVEMDFFATLNAACEHEDLQVSNETCSIFFEYAEQVDTMIEYADSITDVDIELFATPTNIAVAQILSGRAVDRSKGPCDVLGVVEMGIGDLISSIWKAIKNFFIKLWNFITGNGFRLKKKTKSIEEKSEKAKKIVKQKKSKAAKNPTSTKEEAKHYVLYPKGVKYSEAAVEATLLLVKEVDISEINKFVVEGKKHIEGFCKSKTPKTKEIKKFTEQMKAFVTKTSKSLIIIETKRAPLDGSIKEVENEKVELDEDSSSMLEKASEEIVGSADIFGDHVSAASKKTEWIKNPPSMKSKNPQNTKILREALKEYQRLGAMIGKSSTILYKLVSIVDQTRIVTG